MWMLRVGLTGGIGSGKSTVADLFARHGVPVIDTDVIARELVTPGRAALAEIVGAFGADVLDASGQLDRTQLRRRVFTDTAARQRLEAILHPRIRAAVRERLTGLDAAYCLVVVPLLVETKFDQLIDRVLVVDVDEEHQEQRVSRRDGMTADAVRQIMAAQATRRQRIAQADDVIVNNGTIDDLERQVSELHTRYLGSAN